MENSLLYKLLLAYPGTVYNSFPVGLFWIAIGAVIAQKYEDKKIKTSALCIFSAISLMLLMGEYLLINNLDCSVDNDCYFMLIPVCIFIFLLLLNLDVSIKNAKALRGVSTVVYCSHGSILVLLDLLFFNFDTLSLSHLIVRFVITLALSITLAFIILSLSKRNKLCWIRNFY